MAVAVKNVPETASPRTPLQRLARGSVVGVLYVLGSLALTFHGLPYVFRNVLNLDPSSFVNVALLLLAMLGAAAGLTFMGVKLAGPHPPPGLRAGIFSGLVGLLVAVILTNWFAGWTQWNNEIMAPYDLGVFLALEDGMVFLMARFFFMVSIGRRLVC